MTVYGEEPKLLTQRQAEWWREFRTTARFSSDFYCNPCPGKHDPGCCCNAPIERPRSLVRRFFTKGSK